jgi:hypothetical protein
MQVKLDERFIEMCVNKWQSIQRVAGTNSTSSSAFVGTDGIAEIFDSSKHTSAVVENGVNSKPGVEAITSILQVSSEEVAHAYIGSGGMSILLNLFCV